MAADFDSARGYTRTRPWSEATKLGRGDFHASRWVGSGNVQRSSFDLSAEVLDATTFTACSGIRSWVMGTENLPKIERLISQGWDLTVTATNKDKFHATVHLGRRNGPDSHHYIGDSIREAIDGLDRYIDVKESP